MTELEQYKGGGGIKVLNRKPSGADKTKDNKNEEYFYSWGTQAMGNFLDGLASIGDGEWFIGNISKGGGGKMPYSKSHQTGYDVDIAIPIRGGKTSAKEWEAGYDGKDAFKVATAKEMDSSKSLELLKYAMSKGAKFVFLDKDLLKKIIHDYPDNKWVKEFIGEKEPREAGRGIQAENGHADHFHIRLGSPAPMGAKSEPKELETEPEKRKRARASKRSQAQMKRKLFATPFKFINDFSLYGKKGFKAVSEELYTNGDFREWFFGWMMGAAGGEFANARNKPRRITAKNKENIYRSIRKYAQSGYKPELIDDLAFEFIASFVRYYNDGGKEQFKKWLKLNPFIMTTPMQENKNKGNKMMKITRERLVQIIKEEVEAHKASQPNESIDVSEMEEFEVYIKEIADLLKMTYEQLFKGASPTVGTPQTKADTGEDVTDDTAHEDAKAIILDLLGDAIDEFKQGPPEADASLEAMMKHAMSIMEQIDFSAIPNIDYDSINWGLLEGPPTNKALQHAISILEQIDFSSVPNINYDDIRWDMLDAALVPSVEEDIDEQ